MTERSVKTISDIAEIAGVSKSTVSRALNDSPLVNDATRTRIQAIAREHHFRLNAPARNLSLKKSHTIAFVTHAYHQKSCAVQDPFSLEILGGITNGLHALDYDLLVVHVDPRDSGWARQYLDSGRVDGFILMTSNRKKSHIKTLLKIEAPFIVWGPSSPVNAYSSVRGDDLTGGRLATAHLIGRGCRRIAFLGGPPEENEVQQRLLGFEQALQTAGLEPDPDLIRFGDYTYATSLAAMDSLLSRSSSVDAVFATSDVMAIAAIQGIQERGKQVPEDIAVVGYDNLSIAWLNNLPLTTISQNIPLAGKLLAENLIQYLDTGAVSNATLPVELVIRKSA
jgi:DNA-binding LacI/PurR family transcriptional regulator